MLNRAVLVSLAFFVVAMTDAAAQSQSGPANDPVTRLEQSIQEGKTQLAFDQDGFGYLRSLLGHLHINPDSQVLVFSKTSFQQDRISPQTPRAVYFNDDVSVGYVQGGEVYEVSAIDPVRGLQFYTLSARPEAQPTFLRRNVDCNKCHASVNVVVPGLIVASVYPGRDGSPAYTGAGPLFNMTDQHTPFEMRWGGWYVSGTHGSQRHMGNAVAVSAEKPFDLEQEGTQNLTSLREKFDTGKYLLPTSDLVALLTLAHQTQMTNLITSLNARTRNLSSFDNLDGANQRRLDSVIEDLVACMVFADEVPLTEPVRGTSTFADTFPRMGPRDEQGRSLRDFDLRSGLFRYPLSYMVYSPAFDAINATIRDRIYPRLFDVLTGQDGNPKFARLSSQRRLAAYEILRTTKRDLPAYWDQR